MSWLHVLASCGFKMRWPAADYGTSSLRVDTCWKLHLLPCKSISLYANIEYGEGKVEKETQIKVLTCQLCDGHMPQAGANVNGDSVLVPYRVIWQRFCVSIILNLAFCCFSLNPIFRTAGISGHSILVVYGCLFSAPVFLFVCLSWNARFVSQFPVFCAHTAAWHPQP